MRGTRDVHHRLVHRAIDRRCQYHDLGFEALRLVEIHHAHGVRATGPQRSIVRLAFEQLLQHGDGIDQSTPAHRRGRTHRLDQMQECACTRIAKVGAGSEKQQPRVIEDAFEQYVGRMQLRELPPRAQGRERASNRMLRSRCRRRDREDETVALRREQFCRAQSEKQALQRGRDQHRIGRIRERVEHDHQLVELILLHQISAGCRDRDVSRCEGARMRGDRAPQLGEHEEVARRFTLGDACGDPRRNEFRILIDECLVAA